ncbi:MAG TPA: (Fe-S)-binding protein [Chitinophagales bacterium]|nr:(Fe-S)-binding protein [Chitinophagales bacterium]
MDVEIFIPCFIDQLFPETGFNMVKVLERAGCTVYYNPEQTCCGQPAFNAGQWKEMDEVGKKFIKDFSTNDRVVVAPSGSCVGFVRNFYGELYDNGPFHNYYKQLRKNLYEFSEFMVDILKVEDIGGKFNAKITYHDACAALRECKIKSAPRKLVNNIQGIELVEMDLVETCCGFGGTFAVKYEPISTSMADLKIEKALATGADYIVSTDYSCLMHLKAYIERQKLPIQVMHLADLMAKSLS